MKKWHFHDLHGFKDFVTFVGMCAPNHFPMRDFLEPEEQMTLDRAFEGLRFGLDLTAKEKGELPVLSVCRDIIEVAYGFYRNGQVREGFFKLREMEKLIKKIPSQ